MLLKQVLPLPSDDDEVFEGIGEVEEVILYLDEQNGAIT